MKLNNKHKQILSILITIIGFFAPFYIGYNYDIQECWWKIPAIIVFLISIPVSICKASDYKIDIDQV